MGMSFEGASGFLDSVKVRLAAIEGAAKDGLYEKAEAIMTVAKERCPVDTGNLRSTGFVSIQGDAIVMGFGGPSAPYAVYVHERLNVHHPNGEAKFLESAVLEGIAGLPEYMAARLRRAV